MGAGDAEIANSEFHSPIWVSGYEVLQCPAQIIVYLCKILT